MIHICPECGKERNCGCGDCGSERDEICVTCNNKVVLKEAELRNIPISELGKSPLGHYFIKEEKHE